MRTFALSPIVLLVLPFFSTMAGGLLAFRFRRSLALLTAVGAGLLLGAAFLDLLPESISLGAGAAVSAANVLGIALCAYLFFFALDSATQALAERWQQGSRQTRIAGRIAGVMLILHSFRDGMAIGVSYSASHSAGYAVAAGIAAHDLGDGMNTVILTTAGEHPRRSDFLFLLADSLAPLVGGFATAWWIFSARNSVILLATAGGFFLQMATNAFLPRLHADGPSRVSTFVAMLCGVALIYGANLLLRAI